MPYIEQHRRLGLADRCRPTSAGELNYVVSSQVHDYLRRKGLNYDNINTVIGVLEAAKLELYRMVAAPYEDTKRATNGPISTLDGYNHVPREYQEQSRPPSDSKDYVKPEVRPLREDFGGTEPLKPRYTGDPYDAGRRTEGMDEPCPHAPGGG